MKRKFPRALFWIMLMALTACAPAKSERTEAAGVEVEIISTSIASISRADAYPENGRLVVTGRLRRMHEVKFPGHVDIAVYGPEGDLLERKSVSVQGLSSKRKGAMDLPFRTGFELCAPPGSKVVMKYQAVPSGNGNFFNGA